MKNLYAKSKRPFSSPVIIAERGRGKRKGKKNYELLTRMASSYKASVSGNALFSKYLQKKKKKKKKKKPLPFYCLKI
jgi:hypothetical protein